MALLSINDWPTSDHGSDFLSCVLYAEEFDTKWNLNSAQETASTTNPFDKKGIFLDVIKKIIPENSHV